MLFNLNWLFGQKKAPKRIIWTQADDAYWMDTSTTEDALNNCERYRLMFARENLLEVLFSFASPARISVRRTGLDQAMIPVSDSNELLGCLIEVFKVRGFQMSPPALALLLRPLSDDIQVRRQPSQP